MKIYRFMVTTGSWDSDIHCLPVPIRDSILDTIIQQRMIRRFIALAVNEISGTRSLFLPPHLIFISSVRGHIGEI